MYDGTHTLDGPAVHAPIAVPATHAAHLSAREQEADDTRRFVQVLVATLVAMPVLTAVVTILISLQVPEWGFAGALAIGAMVGFWVSIFFGSLIGNSLHELRPRRAHTAVAAAAGRPHADASGAQVAQAAVEESSDLAA